MKEDILEQITADYLNMLGYFTLTNVKYRPSKDEPDWDGHKDGVHSDIDVVGYNPLEHPPSRVIAVNCKSWQTGFWAKDEIEDIANNKEVSGKERWKAFRELANPKWARAFRNKIMEITGESEFEHWIVCTKLCDNHNVSMWTTNHRFTKNLTPYLRIVEMKDIFQETKSMINTTPSNSELGRLIQLLKVAAPELCK